MGIDIEQCCNISKGVKKWDRDKLAANELLELLDKAYKASGGINNGPVYSHALKYIIDEKSDDAVLKEKVAEMIEVEQKVRNMAAHQIVSVTEQWFKENTGKTFKEYVLDMRIGYACKLLNSSMMNISQISATCGFESPVHFNRIFKRVTGMTPTFY